MRTGSLHRARHIVQMLAEYFGTFHQLRLLFRHRIVHQRGIDQLVPLCIGAEDRLHGCDHRQCEERAQRAEQRGERQHREERHGIVHIHGALGDLRRENQILDLLIHADKHQHRHGLPQSAATPCEQHWQRAADIRTQHRNELRNHTAEQRQR